MATQNFPSIYKQVRIVLKNPSKPDVAYWGKYGSDFYGMNAEELTDVWKRLGLKK